MYEPEQCEHTEDERGPALLVVCSTANWLVEEMRVGAGTGLRVVQDYGFALPDIDEHVVAAWWAPAEHVARLAYAGMSLDLCAPGPAWLSTVPEDLTGRYIWAGPLSRVAQAPRSGWAKPAEAKVRGLPSAWWDDVPAFADQALAAGATADSWVQISPARLDLVEEHRCFISHNRVLTTSPYLLDATRTYEPGMEQDKSLSHDGAASFAREVVARLGPAQPPAYSLDVGLTRNGDWVVVEANPAWCSGTYGCSSAGVVEAVVGSSTTTIASSASRYGPWAYVPDPYLTGLARAQPLLKRTPRWSYDPGRGVVAE